MDYWLIWSLVLFAVGLVIVVVEVIVPSGGILGVAALGALVGSLVCAYQLSGWAVVALAAIELVCVPIVVVLAFKILPRTSLGRQLILSPPSSPNTGSAVPLPNAGDGFSALLGVEGKAATMLRPSGTAEFNGRRISVVTRGEMISLGSSVRVIEVEGNRIVVEAV
ncbi:MAG TPA: NfeD family protein [Phycisphaerae bacterium]|nr:NfeD family protein [Phycisphaerae bacterium]